MCSNSIVPHPVITPQRMYQLKLANYASHFNHIGKSVNSDKRNGAMLFQTTSEPQISQAKCEVKVTMTDGH